MKFTKTKKSWLILAIILFAAFSNTSFSQTPNSILNLGILESFEAYTGSGGVTNSGGTVTGDVGTNLGIISGFTSPPYTGDTYNANAVTDQARFDLLRLYIHLNALFVNFPSAFDPVTFPAHGAAFGAGETISPGVYSIGSAGSIGGALTLNGGGDPNAIFVIKMNGALTIGADVIVTLSNGTNVSNVYWVIGGAISVAAGAQLKGTLLAKAGAVGIGANVILEGRMLCMAGAITMGIGSSATLPSMPSTIPIFCDPYCTPAPAADILGVLSGFTLYAKSGNVGNTGITGIIGNIGANAGAITGYSDGINIGTEQIANALTLQAEADLDNAYIALMNMTPTATHSATFLNETLAPGVYNISTAGALGGVIILDAANDPNAIFVFRFAGAFNIAAATKMVLANGARRCNIFWLGGAGVATGAVNIGASCEIQGTFIAHGGACNSGGGVFLAGRQLSTGGSVNSNTAVIYNNPECVTSLSLNSTLPIELLSFTGECNNQNVLFNWKTASEHNSDFFSLERSIDGLIWVNIGKIPAAGNSTSEISYNYSDYGRYYDISYYRLIQTDFDGQTKIYNPIAINKCNETNELLFVEPNPAVEQININYSGDFDKVLFTSVYDLYGKSVYFNEVYSSTIPIVNIQDGIYYLQLVLESGIIVRKFCITNKN